MNFIELMSVLLALGMITGFIIGDIMIILAFLKCFGKKKCSHTQCAFQNFCRKKPDFTSEEYMQLLDKMQMMLDEKKKELGIKCHPTR